jgi:hypothetical protein
MKLTFWKTLGIINGSDVDLKFKTCLVWTLGLSIERLIKKVRSDLVHWKFQKIIPLS